MPKYPGFEVHANFYVDYLKKFLLERNIRYTKSHLREITEPYYLEELIKRPQEDKHLLSFQNLVDLFREIKANLEP